MIKAVFKVGKMDCASEEHLIRMKLESYRFIKHLDFDIANRMLVVLHEGNTDLIQAGLVQLNLNSKLISSEAVEDSSELLLPEVHGQERSLLRQVLIINFFFFMVEIITGVISNSMGLVADSLDMLADALVYALALFVVGKELSHKLRIAKVSGCLQLVLALFGFAEVIRRFSGYGENPNFKTMIVISLFALVGNAISLYLLQKSKSKEAHIQASMIFTSTDVIVNIGVIIAGSLVYVTSSSFPDLVIGAIVFGLVMVGSIRILKLSK